MDKIDTSGTPPIKKLTKKDRFISKTKRRVLKHTWIVRSSIVVGIILVVYLVFLGTQVFFRSLDISSYVSIASSFIFTPKDGAKTFEGKTNLVILGKSGGDNDSPDLTDTIIFVSVDHEDGSINLISIPRDIWVDELRAKINSTYYWGEQKQEGGGLILSKSIVEKVVGKPVHYGVVIDFDGFVEIIDELEGIEVNVENGFTDERYPIEGKEDDECDGDLDLKCRYEVVKFDAGLQKMDGATALKFVRSRNADGTEGTDLARAQRQQDVVSALKDKSMSPEVVLSPKKMISFFNVASRYIESDMDPKVVSILTRRVVQARKNLHSSVIPEDLLINPPASLYDNLYVFVPESDEGWVDVYKWVEETIND